jgi:hypothetical protein
MRPPRWQAVTVALDAGLGRRKNNDHRMCWPNKITASTPGTMLARKYQRSDGLDRFWK